MMVIEGYDRWLTTPPVEEEDLFQCSECLATDDACSHGDVCEECGGGRMLWPEELDRGVHDHEGHWA